jgi:cardiolipin synthase
LAAKPFDGSDGAKDGWSARVIQTLPNLITVGRIVLVPVVIWAITSGNMLLAFWLFVAAGISDAVDGFIAKRFNAQTEFGAYLDPLADKALLMSIYITLSIEMLLPRWIVIAVVSRDIMIMGAVILSWVLNKPVEIHPLIVSKLNTAAQIALAALVLASTGFKFDAGQAKDVLLIVAGGLTLVSAAAYLIEWMKHMTTDAPEPGK